jgi:hypothetical protein
MSEESANAADLFEIIRTTRSMRRLKPDPVPERIDPTDPRGGRVCAERRQHAALALLGNPRSEGQRDCRGLVQSAPGMNRWPRGIGRANRPLA